MHNLMRQTACFYLALFITPALFASELNLNFLHGVAKDNIPDILSSDAKFPKGQYLVDVFFNRQNIGKQLLVIAPEDKDNYCFPSQWLTTSGLPLKKEAILPYFDQQRQCYYLDKLPSAHIDFDYSNQSLKISLPQIAITEESNIDNWDYGIPGVRLAYNTNASQNNLKEKYLYGFFNFNANYDRWVLAGQTSGFEGQGFNTPEATLSTAIAPIRGNLIIGKTHTQSTILPDFTFYGISLRSESMMQPWHLRGYAPVISGIANSNARITVSQGNYTLSSHIVPPGPYSLNNISPIGNGELTVTVEEEDGQKTVRTYPMTTLPTLLRENDFNYNFVLGSRHKINNEKPVNGLFGLASVDYGLAPFTLNSATILHEKYQSLGLGITKDFGLFGALSASINGANSHFQSDHAGTLFDETLRGFSGTIRYGKGFNDSTNLQLLSYRYLGEKYVDFSEFYPSNDDPLNHRRDRYEAIITHNLGTSFISASAWLQHHRENLGRDTGISLSASTALDGIYFSLTSSYEKYSQFNRNDYAMSVTMSVPFNWGNRSHYSTSNLNYTKAQKTRLSSGVSGNLSDDINYNISGTLNDNQQSASAYTGIAFDAVQTGFSLSQTEGTTAISMSAAGSIIATQPTGFLFTKEQNDTLAVVKVDQLKEVRFNQSRPTNAQGNTVLYLTPYSSNEININTDGVPDDVELLHSSFKMVPTKNSIVYREFKYVDTLRYVLRLLDRQGDPIAMGSRALTDQQIEAGFVSNRGILLLNVLEAPQYIIIRQQDGQQCRVNMQGITPAQSTVKEVHCE